MQNQSGAVRWLRSGKLMGASAAVAATALAVGGLALADVDLTGGPARANETGAQSSYGDEEVATSLISVDNTKAVEPGFHNTHTVTVQALNKDGEGVFTLINLYTNADGQRKKIDVGHTDWDGVATFQVRSPDALIGDSQGGGDEEFQEGVAKISADYALFGDDSGKVSGWVPVDQGKTVDAVFAYSTLTADTPGSDADGIYSYDITAQLPAGAASRNQMVTFYIRDVSNGQVTSESTMSNDSGAAGLTLRNQTHVKAQFLVTATWGQHDAHKVNAGYPLTLNYDH